MKLKKKFDYSNLTLYWYANSAGLFVGMGVGFLLDNLVPWMFIGIGFGFLLMLIIRLFHK